ncbi:DUF6285 domain-containing protein [uncultured Zhongshania sp.]|uniref:DUF6285 domain-containing protein n=1 Tax=uncultured Zhongshania sp. TaxID=1642288 RepID=UPI0025F9C583|nr:DUF6285 domain-containing protein [uncultured Zhongshania sp.]
MPVNKPNISQLCDALQSFLETELAPAVSDSALKYKLKIAGNVLGIIARESELGEDFKRMERDELNTLLGDDGSERSQNQRLVEFINSADIRPGEDDILPVLERITLAKMAIDNPRYASYVKHVDP